MCISVTLCISLVWPYRLKVNPHRPDRHCQNGLGSSFVLKGGALHVPQSTPLVHCWKYLPRGPCALQEVCVRSKTTPKVHAEQRCCSCKTAVKSNKVSNRVRQDPVVQHEPRFCALSARRSPLCAYRVDTTHYWRSRPLKSPCSLGVVPQK